MHRSNKDLQVLCKKEGDDASLKAKQAAETTAKDAKAEVPAAVSGSK